MESKEYESEFILSSITNIDVEEDEESNSQIQSNKLLLSNTKNIDPEKKEKKSGVLYIQTVPPNFTVSKMRAILSQYSEIGRIYFQVYFFKLF